MPDNDNLIGKKGRPESGRGSYLRPYLNKEHLEAYDKICVRKKMGRTPLATTIMIEWIEQNKNS